MPARTAWAWPPTVWAASKPFCRPAALCVPCTRPQFADRLRLFSLCHPPTDEEDQAGAAVLPRVRRARGAVRRERACAHPAEAPRLRAGAVRPGRRRGMRGLTFCQLPGSHSTHSCILVNVCSGGSVCQLLRNPSVPCPPCRELGSGSWAEPPSPSTTVSSSGLPSPKAQPLPQQQQQLAPAAWQQDGAAGDGQPQPARQQGSPMPQCSVPALPSSPRAAGVTAATSPRAAACSLQGSLPAVRLRAAAAAADDAAEPIPDSPPSMAAVLQAEAGELSITELPADEFLLAPAEPRPASPQL